MIHNKFRYLLTLVALLAVTTGAWAEETTTVSADFEDGNMPAGWDASQAYNTWYVDTQDYWGYAPAYSGTYSLYVDGNGTYDDDYFISPALEFAGAGSVSFAYVTPSWFGDQNDLTVAYSTSPTGPWTNTSFVHQTSENWTTATVDLSALNGTYYIAFISYDNYGYFTAIDNINITFPAPAGPEVTWNATTKQATFAMPGSNVVLTPIYAKAAAFATTGSGSEVTTLLPAAAEGVIAGTDAPLIVEGTVAFAGQSTEVRQGTVMYAVTAATATEAPALTSSDWKTTVPTAKDIADDGAEVKVWYYIQGADAPQGEAATLDNTFNNSDICATPLTVTVLSNKFDLTLKAANANTIDATQASKGTVTVNGTDKTGDITDGKLQGVKMGSEVKLKANNGYKFRKVEVKKDKKTLTITDGGQFSTLLNIEGCTTWDEVIAKNSDQIKKDADGFIYDKTGQYALLKGDGDNASVNADNPFDPNATDYKWQGRI